MKEKTSNGKNKEEIKLDNLRDVVFKEIKGVLKDVHEIKTHFGDNYHFFFSTNSLFIHLIVNLGKNEDETLIDYTAYDSEEDFVEDPSFNKHEVISDIRLKGKLSDTLPRMIKVITPYHSSITGSHKLK